MVPAVGGVESSVKVRLVTAVLPATSRPVTASPGPVVVPAVQSNALETKGPPAGVETEDGVWDQPVDVPVRAAVLLLAGPEPASATALVSRRLPAAVPR